MDKQAFNDLILGCYNNGIKSLYVSPRCFVEIKLFIKDFSDNTSIRAHDQNNNTICEIKPFDELDVAAELGKHLKSTRQTFYQGSTFYNGQEAESSRERFHFKF